MGIVNNLKNKASKKVKNKAKLLGAKATMIVVMGIIKILPLILCASILSAAFSWVIELITAENTPNEIYSGFEIENVVDLVEIKGDDTKGYYLDFVDDINEKLDKIIESSNQKEGTAILPKSNEFLKKIIKAEVITQFPDLRGEIPEETDGFQGAIDIRRITPNKEIGEVLDTKNWTTTVDEDKDKIIEDMKDEGGALEKDVKSWKEGKQFVTNTEEIIYDQEESKINQGTYINHWKARPKKDDPFSDTTISKNTTITYTGKYGVVEDPITKRTQVYAEIKTDDLTGYIYVQAGHLTATNNTSTETSGEGSTNNTTTTTTNKKYKVAIDAGHVPGGGATSNGVYEGDLTRKIVAKIKELFAGNDNIEVIDTTYDKDATVDDWTARRNQATNANVDLLVSVHINAGGGSGFCMVYNKEGGNDRTGSSSEAGSSEASYNLGANIKAAMTTTLSGSMLPTDDVSEPLSIIGNSSNTTYPSVVAECGYIDNASDFAIMTSDDGQQKIAQGIVNGITQYLSGNGTVNGNEVITNRKEINEIESKVYNMKYVSQEKFQKMLDDGDKDILKKFTLDDDKKLVTAKWQLDAEGTIKFTKNSVINFRTALQKLVIPFEYLLYFYIDSDYAGFSEALADEAINSEIVIAVQDNVTTTDKTDEISRKRESEPPKIESSEWNIEETINTKTEMCSTKIEITYADTWCAKYYKENSYSAKDLGLTGDEDEKVVKVKGKATDETKVGDSGVGASREAKSKEVHGVTVDYTLITYEQTITTTRVITNKYEAGEAITKGNENKFVKAYHENGMISKVDPDWLFDIIENNATKTANLLNLTKYLIYKATGDDYGVREYDFSEFAPSEFSSIKSSGNGGISLTTTMFTREVFIQAMEAYGAKSGNSGFIANFMPNAGEIYDVSVASGVNPELVVVTAKTEQNFVSGGGAYNYWGIGVYNGSNSGGSYGSLAEGIQAYAAVIQSYGPDGRYAAAITQKYEERKDSGCDPLGYGMPGTLSGMQSIYSYLGKHTYGSSGAGGYYYMDPARAGVTYIYSTHEDFLSKCYNLGGEHAEGTETTPWEQGQYTAWQLQGKIDAWNEIFGDYGSLSGGGEFLNKAKEVWEKVCASFSNYGGTPIPPPGSTIDCSSYVSWVLYEYGYTEFAGGQHSTVSFVNTNWNEKYGWEEIPISAGENVSDKVQPGDILVRDAGRGSNGHMLIVEEVRDGQLYCYDCGDESNWIGKGGEPCTSTYFLSYHWAGKIIRVTPPR